MRIVSVRDGSAILLGALADTPVVAGDVILIDANALCGAEPEGRTIVTTICLDTDYMLDQAFWQHSDVNPDRYAARGFTEVVYFDPVQVVRLGETRLGQLGVSLDELVALSEQGHRPTSFFRMQALLFTVVDALAPHLRTTPVPVPRARRQHAVPALPRWRRFVAIRPEVHEVEAAMRTDIARPWPLATLGGIAHLSGSQCRACSCRPTARPRWRICRCCGSRR